MSPGDISSLSLSDAVAFRVRFDGPIPEPRERYWRGLVLHRFNGRTWSGSDPAIGRRASQQIEVSGEPIKYQVTMEPTRQHFVFALDLPYRWDLEQTFMGRQQALARVYPIDQRIAYEAESYTNYRSQAELNSFSFDWYVTLPQGTNPEAARFARELRTQVDSDQAFVDALLKYFNDEGVLLHARTAGAGPRSCGQVFVRYASRFLRTLRVSIFSPDTLHRHPVARCRRLPGRRAQSDG